MLYQLSYLAHVDQGGRRGRFRAQTGDHNNQSTPGAMRRAVVFEFRFERGDRRGKATRERPSDVCDLASDGANQHDDELERAYECGSEI